MPPWRGLGAHGAVVDKDFAKSNKLVVGSPLRIETPAGKYLELRVAAIFSPPQGGSPLGNVTISSSTFDSVYPDPAERVHVRQCARRRDRCEHRQAEQGAGDLP